MMSGDTVPLHMVLVMTPFTVRRYTMLALTMQGAMFCVAPVVAALVMPALLIMPLVRIMPAMLIMPLMLVMALVLEMIMPAMRIAPLVL